MFKKILVANRGNIAVNIINACKELGMETVAVYSDVDKEAVHIKHSDKAYYLGKARFNEGYIDIDKIVDIAVKENVDIIHPGFGFLAQNIEFLKKCEENNIKVVGETSERMELFSNKIEIKTLVSELGIPVIKGREIASSDDLKEVSTPYVIKPAKGYAGRGIQYVEKQSEAKHKLERAQKENKAFFGDNSLYAEEYIDKAYLIEVCVIGNGKKFVALPTTDSSLRIKFQKVFSESPAEYIDIKIRKKIVDYAKKIAKELKLDSIGNFEFLVSKKNIFFMEFNPRLPISYSVLEMLTGFNLIKEQINIAFENKTYVEEIPLEKIKGNAVECRIHAEDSFNKFTPSTGKIDKLIIPGGKDVRIELDYFGKDTVSSYYDSQIAKVLVKNLRREEMVNKILWVLGQLKITGICTTIPFLYNVVNTKLFAEGKIVSDFVTHVMKERRFKKVREKEYVAAIIASISYYEENKKNTVSSRVNLGNKDYSPWNIVGRTKIIRKWE